MLNLTRFDIRAWATWERGTLDLAKRGTTFIRGINEDAGGDKSNGAGKSSLLNGLSALVTGDHQLAVRKRSLKSLTSDHTRMLLRGLREESPFSIDMKGTKLAITRDGKLVDNRTKDSARRAVDDIICMSPELWAATVHINGIAGNPLIRGTSAARCQFLERAFDLDRWVKKHEAIKDVMSGMRRAVSDLDDAKAELAKLPPSVNVVQLGFEDIDLTNKIAKLTAALKTTYDTLSKVQALPPKPKRDVAFYAKAAKDIETKLRNTNGTAESHARWLFACSKQEAIDKTRADLRLTMLTARKVIKTKHDLNIEAMRTEADAIRDQQRRATIAAKYASVVDRWRSIASSIADKHGIRFKSDGELRSMSLAWVSSLRDGDSRCPVCGSAFKSKVDRKILNVLAKLTDELPDDLSVGSAALPDLQRLKQLESKVFVAGDYLLARDELSKLTDVTIPPKCEHDPNLALELARKLSSANELLSRARMWDDAPSVDQEAMQTRLDSLTERKRIASERVAEIKTIVAEAVAAANIRQALEHRIIKLTEEVALHPIYKALQGAYSSTGMRMWLLTEMVEAIVASLNESAGNSRDRVHYGYKLSRNRDLALTASNLTSTFDVRLLSGGESGVFCINLITALLPLLPDHKRCSMLVLDEVDANCDRPTRSMLASEHLPRLAEIVPSLFVVTPYERRDFRMEGAHELVVIKRGGVSAFQRG